MVLLLDADAYGCILLVGHCFGELWDLVSHGLDLCGHCIHDSTKIIGRLFSGFDG